MATQHEPVNAVNKHYRAPTNTSSEIAQQSNVIVGKRNGERENFESICASLLRCDSSRNHLRRFVVRRHQQQISVKVLDAPGRFTFRRWYDLYSKENRSRYMYQNSFV